MKNIGWLAMTFLLVPSFAFAFTKEQVGAIIGLLRAFGVEEQVLQRVYVQIMTPTTTASPQTTEPATTPSVTIVVPNVEPQFGTITQPIPNPSPQPTLTPMPEPIDTTPPVFDLFSIDILQEGTFLRITAREPLDFSKTTISSGTIERVVMDNYVQPNSVKVRYYSEAKLSGVEGIVRVTVKDLAGNEAIRDVVVK